MCVKQMLNMVRVVAGVRVNGKVYII